MDLQPPGPVSDPLGTEPLNGMTDPGWAGRLARVDGHVPLGLAATAEVLLKQLAGPGRLIAGEIERGDLLAVDEQRIELARAGFGPEGTRHDPDHSGGESVVTLGRSHATENGLDDGRRIESVRARHEERAETQLEPLESLGSGVLDRFGGYALAGLQVEDGLGRVVVAAKIGHEVGDRSIQLNQAPRFLLVAAGQLGDRRRPQGTLEMTVQIDHTVKIAGVACGL